MHQLEIRSSSLRWLCQAQVSARAQGRCLEPLNKLDEFTDPFLLLSLYFYNLLFYFFTLYFDFFVSFYDF